MAYNGTVFAGTLASVNIAAAGALTVIGPLIAGIDSSLFGPLGIGVIQADLQAQINASLEASANIAIGFTNPLDGFLRALEALKLLEAAILRALSSGIIPAVSVQVTTQLSALAAFQAAAGARLGGLNALLQGLKLVRTPAVTFAGLLNASLSAGGAFVVSFDGITLSAAGASIAADFSLGLTYGMDTIAPGETVYGVVILTKLPSTWTALQAILLT